MTSNFFQTILIVLAGAIPLVISILGCTTLPDGVTVDCSASWIGPVYAGIASAVLMGLVVLLKAFGGGAPGTGLVAKMVPVVPVDKAAPGVVTAAQVAAPASHKK